MKRFTAQARLALAFATLLFPVIGALADDPIPLITPESALEDWTFNNGREFPGATGSLTLDPEADLKGKASLKLTGDFTGGGGYVQAGRKLEDIDIRSLSLWVRSAETDHFTLRLGDASGQTHQIVLKIEPGSDWQQVEFPLERFFARRGKADAVTSIAKYESWGGAKDGNWHGPAQGIYLLLSKRGEDSVRTLWLNGIEIVPKPMPIAGAELKSEVRLDEIVEGIHDWRFTNGAEFKGAKGSLTVAEDEPEPGQSCLKLKGDFTGGGAYVAAIRDLSDVEAAEVPAIRMRVKSANAKSVSIQLVDATGQTHQRKGLPIVADGAWHDFDLKPAEIAGGEHWGGANDGMWHGPPRQLVISLTTRSDPPAHLPEILLADIRAETVLPVFAQPAAFKSEAPIILTRTLEGVEKPAAQATSTFTASPGQWEIRFDSRADLNSPDNSYNGVLQLECFGAADQVVEAITITDVFGKQDPRETRKLVELPKGTVSARFRAQLNKTWGEFEIGNLSAAYLAPAARRDDRIERLLFSTAQLGNLLFPEDPREVGVTVETRKPLKTAQATINYVVRDYWGAEQMAPARVTLGSPEKKQNRFVYEASIDLKDVPLEVGRYYELHAAVGGESGGAVKIEPFRNHTSLAILPEAVTRQYPPEEVPFTSRNWDNRMSEFIRLTDRLGVRICGLWGGWSPKPPYKPEAPGLELCQELGMGWLTTTPIKHIERGKDDEWTEEALRQGVRNFLEKYGDARPLIINLGNEPHGTGDRVRKNVEAYRIVYEEVKKVDPNIPVVATSVEPNEEYFKNGYGQWCDAYDFHIYEQPEKVRDTMEAYGALMKQYDVVKPLWSTELGLNSQGQPRHEVAVQVFKKFSTFFAAGGENVSWFGLCYPDPDGTQHGSSGDSHNVFDCRFNRYCPRLDAVAYYHAVNAIAIKKFVEEKRYPNGISSFLFRDRDGHCLQVLWKEEGRDDVFLPLKDVAEVKLIRIDGRGSALNAGGKGLTLSVTSDPLVLLYDDPEGGLAAALETPAVALVGTPENFARRGPTELAFDVKTGFVGEFDLKAPPFWKVENSSKDKLRFTVTPPDSTAVREGEFILEIGQGTGELYGRLPLSD